MKQVTIELSDDVVDRLLAIDCGDNSCLYRDRLVDHGVGTNGGCRCIKDLRTEVRLPVGNLLSCVIRNLRDQVAA